MDGVILEEKKKIAVDLTVPVAFNQPPAYSFIKKFLRKLNLEKESVEILTNHRSILSVVREQEQVSPVHWLTAGEAKTVWRNVAHSALQNRHKDLAWMAAHEILPVRAVMHSRGMAKNPACPRIGCGAPETVRHALWECSAVRNLWATVGPQQFPCLPAGGVKNYLMVLGGMSQKGMPAATHTDLWLTINCVKDAIWTSRNLLVGKRVEVSLQATLLLAKARRQEYTLRRHSEVGAEAPRRKVRTATSSDCP